MKQFKVFKHPTGEFQAVKQGWCWPAFFFEIFWSIFARMWGVMFVTIIASIVVSIVEENGSNTLGNIFLIVTAIIFGASGNTWRENKLLSKGFELIDTITAANKEAAIALAIKNSLNT